MCRAEPSKGRLDLDYLANGIAWCGRRVAGGTLVLFTSHHDLRQVRDRTRAFFNKIQRPLFRQGHEHARSELTAILRPPATASCLAPTVLDRRGLGSAPPSRR